MGAIFGLRTGQLDDASRRALALAEELGDEPLTGWACYKRAWWAFNSGRLAESLLLHERIRDIARRLDDVSMGAWVAFGRAIFSGIYLHDPLTARAWGLALPRLDAFPRQRANLLDHLGQARGNSGDLTEARRIADSLGPGTVVERMCLYWSGEWERAEAAWMAARDRDARSGDRLDNVLSAYWLGRVRRAAGYEAAEAAFAEGLAIALEGRQTSRGDAGRRRWQVRRSAQGVRGRRGDVPGPRVPLGRGRGPLHVGHGSAGRSRPAEGRAVDIYRGIGAGDRWATWAAEPTG
jgi:hypothetical protein